MGKEPDETTHSRRQRGEAVVATPVAGKGRGVGRVLQLGALSLLLLVLAGCVPDYGAPASAISVRVLDGKVEVAVCAPYAASDASLDLDNGNDWVEYAFLKGTHQFGSGDTFSFDDPPADLSGKLKINAANSRRRLRTGRSLSDEDQR